MSLTRLKELVVLSLVEAHPMHGYALVEALGAGLGPSLDLKAPALYATLRRFEARGWIEAERERDGRRPERAVFRLTEAGAAGLARLRSEAARRPPPPLAPLAVLLAHFDALEPAPRREALERLRDARRARRAQLEAFPAHEGCAGAALDLMRRQLELELEALDRLLASD